MAHHVELARHDGGIEEMKVDADAKSAIIHAGAHLGSGRYARAAVKDENGDTVWQVSSEDYDPTLPDVVQ